MNQSKMPLAAQDCVDRILESRAVTPCDVMELRRMVYPDGVVSRAEAEALFLIESTRQGGCPEWGQFFREALSDHIVHQVQPSGYVTEESAEWLIGQINAISEPRTDTLVGLLANIVRIARDLPPGLAAFALKQAKNTAIYADGVDPMGEPHEAGKVTQADVEMLRRIIWAAGSEGHLAVSREEAEALFDIADATAGADNHPDWDEFFARAVGNYLVGATGRHVPSREMAIRREADADYEVSMMRVLTGALNGLGRLGSPGSMLMDMLDSRTLGEAIEERSRLENAARISAIADGQNLVGEKAQWLVERVNRNGRMTAPEEALIAFVAREATRFDAAVAVLVDQVKQAQAA
jgi:hypothetical protein